VFKLKRVLVKSDIEGEAETGLLNKSSFLAPALGVTNLQIQEICFWSHFVLLLKSDLDVRQTEAGLLNKCSFVARALGVTKFIIITDMIWVTLCCAT
jgi:hypothetical protein